MSNEVKELYVLAQIREAIGDPHGKLMQDELIEKIRDLRNRTIEECAIQVETQERGTNYQWVNNSMFGNLTGQMARQIRKLRTSKNCESKGEIVP